MGKNFLYLVHGADNLIQNSKHLSTRPNADLIMSTYNKRADGAHYFPGSTWAEGRNGLLHKALELDNSYEYYIFMDDDVEFEEGGYDELESQLIRLKPAVAVPVFIPKSLRTILGFGISYNHRFFFPISSYQVCKFGDGQVMAFHRDVIKDGMLTPLLNKFDEISWWYTSSTQQILAHNLYSDSFIQLNNVIVTNESHREYTRNSFEEQQKAWFDEQFSVPVKNPRPFALNLLTYEGLRQAFNKCSLKEMSMVFNVFLSTVIGTLFYKKKESHRLEESTIKSKFKEGVELYNQYFDRKTR